MDSAVAVRQCRRNSRFSIQKLGFSLIHIQHRPMTLCVCPKCTCIQCLRVYHFPQVSFESPITLLLLLCMAKKPTTYIRTAKLRHQIVQVRQCAQAHYFNGTYSKHSFMQFFIGFMRRCGWGQFKMVFCVRPQFQYINLFIIWKTHKTHPISHPLHHIHNLIYTQIWINCMVTVMTTSSFTWNQVNSCIFISHLTFVTILFSCAHCVSISILFFLT